MARISRRMLLTGGASTALALGLSGLGQTAFGQNVTEQATAPNAPPKIDPAEIIIDPRVTTFDIGPADQPWRIQIGMPKVPPPAEGYSAILALDGNATFPMLWKMREESAPDAPVLLIGLGYPTNLRFDTERRWYDLTSLGMTPQVLPEGGNYRPPGERPTGGRERLLQAIANDILPEVAKRAPLDSGDLTLYGHSLGGLFVLYALMTWPNLFNRYASADPSIWWNAGEALREADAFIGGVRASGSQLAPEIEMLMSFSRGKADSPVEEITQSQPEIFRKLSQISGLKLHYRAHPDKTHPELIEPSLREALDLHLGQLR